MNGLTRRSMLKGMGVSIALPWMESLRAQEGKAQPPVRMAVLFAGNGFHAKEWWAKGAGASMELGKVLEPLAPFKEKLLFIKGLYNQEAGKGGIHSAQTGNLLTGSALEGGGGIRSGVSVDQHLANTIGRETKVPSLVLGCEESISALHKGYSMIYSSHISWSSPTTPTPLELYPSLAFDQLFRDEVGAGDASVLDQIAGDAKSLGQKGRLQGWRPSKEKPDLPRPADGLPRDVDEHMRLMCDILVLAFQTDTTRLATLKLNNDHSSQRFPHLKIDYMIHHLLSHTDNDDWLKVNRFFTEQVAYIATKMDQVQEGERTLLDNSMVLYLSSMMTGNHNNDQLPVVMLGGAGGQIKAGRVLDYLDKPNRKMCSLYLSLMDKTGVRLDSFGDSKERLAEI